MTTLDLKIGTDPETFLKLGDKIISAHGIIPGTKVKPYKLDKGAVQLDGVACEFNIDPAKTAEEFDDNIETVLAQVKEIVKKADKDIEILFEPIARFEPAYWATIPDHVKVLGCDPDFDRMGNVIEKDITFISSTPLRTAAGHIHLGFCENIDVKDFAHFEDCRFLAEFFSKYSSPIGVYHSMTPGERERLKYYGGNGAFRPKPYGVELRQWSNIWVRHKESRRDTFTFMKKTIELLFKG